MLRTKTALTLIIVTLSLSLNAFAITCPAKSGEAAFAKAVIINGRAPGIPQSPQDTLPVFMGYPTAIHILILQQ